jgi:hypothetical protein
LARKGYGSGLSAQVVREVLDELDSDDDRLNHPTGWD